VVKYCSDVAARSRTGKLDMNTNNRLMYLLMTIVVISWGLEYILAKQALEVLDPFVLIFCKYIIGFIVVLPIKLKLEGKSLFRVKDIPILLAGVLVGDITYYYMEYTAMDYLPVSLISIILGLVPALSICIERVMYKNKITKKLSVGVVFSFIGIALIIGIDLGELASGRLLGYLMAGVMVVCWNIYNFITASLEDLYRPVTLTLLQITGTVIVTGPYAISRLADVALLTPGIAGGVLYLGVFSTGISFMILVKAIYQLGPTATAMFSNFLPVTTTIFGWLLLQEVLHPLQILGGVVVITAGILVIREKGRLEEISHD